MADADTQSAPVSADGQNAAADDAVAQGATPADQPLAARTDSDDTVVSAVATTR